MKKLRKILMAIACTACLSVGGILAACSGTEGPVGPAGPQGVQGEQGDPGDPGAAGKDGATWLTGTGAPAADKGKDGDFYLDTASFDLYLKADGAWSKTGNLKGGNGNDGADGASWLTGTGAPDAADGKDGDIYLDKGTLNLWEKADGAWSAFGNLNGNVKLAAPAVTYEGGELSWDEVDGADGYTVYFNDKEIHVTGTSWSVPDEITLAGVSKAYVTATDSTGEYAESAKSETYTVADISITVSINDQFILDEDWNPTYEGTYTALLLDSENTIVDAAVLDPMNWVYDARFSGMPAADYTVEVRLETEYEDDYLLIGGDLTFVRGNYRAEYMVLDKDALVELTGETGDYSGTVDLTIADSGVSYFVAFTAPEDGWYKISIPENLEKYGISVANALDTFSEPMINQANDDTPENYAKIYLAEGETLILDVQLSYMGIGSGDWVLDDPDDLLSGHYADWEDYEGFGPGENGLEITVTVESTEASAESSAGELRYADHEVEPNTITESGTYNFFSIEGQLLRFEFNTRTWGTATVTVKVGSDEHEFSVTSSSYDFYLDEGNNAVEITITGTTAPVALYIYDPSLSLTLDWTGEPSEDPDVDNSITINNSGTYNFSSIDVQTFTFTFNPKTLSNATITVKIGTQEHTFSATDYSHDFELAEGDNEVEITVSAPGAYALYIYYPAED